MVEQGRPRQGQAQDSINTARDTGTARVGSATGPACDRVELGIGRRQRGLPCPALPALLSALPYPALDLKQRTLHPHTHTIPIHLHLHPQLGLQQCRTLSCRESSLANMLVRDPWNTNLRSGWPSVPYAAPVAPPTPEWWESPRPTPPCPWPPW